jgi:hypothetical protein
MQALDAEALLLHHGIIVEPDRLPVFAEAYARWRTMTEPLRQPFPFGDEPIFPPAGAR